MPPLSSPFHSPVTLDPSCLSLVSVSVCNVVLCRRFFCFCLFWSFFLSGCFCQTHQLCATMHRSPPLRLDDAASPNGSPGPSLLSPSPPLRFRRRSVTLGGAVRGNFYKLYPKAKIQILHVWQTQIPKTFFSLYYYSRFTVIFYVPSQACVWKRSEPVPSWFSSNLSNSKA